MSQFSVQGWLQKIYALCSENDQLVVNKIIEDIDDLCTENLNGHIDDLLISVELERLPSAGLLALLSAVAPAHREEKLEGYAAFFARVEAALALHTEITPLRRSHLLRGFSPELWPARAAVFCGNCGMRYSLHAEGKCPPTPPISDAIGKAGALVNASVAAHQRLKKMSPRGGR